jgi:hypothetical protein
MTPLALVLQSESRKKLEGDRLSSSSCGAHRTVRAVFLPTPEGAHTLIPEAPIRGTKVYSRPSISGLSRFRTDTEMEPCEVLVRGRSGLGIDNVC